MNYHYLIFIGVLAQFISVLSYIKAMMRGEAKPNRVSWFFWIIAPLIGSIAAFMAGVRWALVPVIMSWFGPFLVFSFSLFNKQAYWKLQPFDYWCAVFSGLALLLWGLTKQPLVAIIFSVLADFLAAIPTIIKARKFPETEKFGPYLAGAFSATLSLLIVKSWLLTEILFPAYLIFVNLLIVLAICVKFKARRVKF